MGDRKFERVGECKRCGKCCMELEWITVFLNGDDLAWLKAHSDQIQANPNGGYQYDKETGEKVADGYDVSLPFRCEQLIIGALTPCACKLHGDEKPKICRIYPTLQHFLDGCMLDGCGFSFVEVANA